MFANKGSQTPNDQLFRSDSVSSLDDLVRHPHSLADTPVSLKVCLQSLFDKGWSPEPGKCGMYRLLEESVVWLKSMVKSQQPTLEFPDLVKELLVDFGNFSSATSHLDKYRDQRSKVMATARATVEHRMKEASGLADEMFKKRKAALETWLCGKEAEAKEREDDLELHQSSLRCIFENRIQEVIRLTFQDWQQGKATPMEIEFNDDDFLKELDAELEAGLNLNPEKPQNLQGGGENTKATLETVKPADKRLVEQDTMGEKPEEKPPVETTSPKGPVGEEGNKTGGGNTVEPHQRNVIIPKGVDVKQVHMKVNIFDREVCKAIKWSPEDGGNAGSSTTPAVPTAAPATGENTTPATDESTTSATPSAPPTTSAPGLRRANAMTGELRRMDTSDLDNEDLEKIKVNVDGVVMYKKPKGGLETWDEREKRLGHNSYMRFSRSFDGLIWWKMKDVFLHQKTCMLNVSFKKGLLIILWDDVYMKQWCRRSPTSCCWKRGHEEAQ